MTKDTQDQHASPTTRSLIEAARTLRGVPRQKRITPPEASTVSTALLARARAAPERPYLAWRAEDPAERFGWTYGEFLERAEGAARWLHDALGLRPGERVATAASNHPATVLLYFAAWRLGLTVVPINVNEDDARVRFVAENAEVSAVFVRPDLMARITSATEGLPGLRHRAALDLAGMGRGAAPLEGVPPPDPDAEALIVYTSGTTGLPKGVSLDQYALAADAQSIARWHRFDGQSRLLCVLPIHHVNGIVVTLLTPVLAGASVVLTPRFRTPDFWPALAEHQVNVVSVVPTLLAFLLEEDGGGPSPAPADFRYPICGAGPLTVDLAAQFEDRFQRPVLHGYGLSETTCYSCFLPLDLPPSERRRWMRERGFPSIGCAIDVNEMAIHGPAGGALAPGERGEIVIRGHNVCRHYHRRPESNAETFAHGWFRSGDEGFYEDDAAGRRFFFITGRLKELIIRGGVKVSPFEVDEVLMALPGARAALAVGFENRFYGEEVGAYVWPDDSPEGRALTAEKVLAHCRERLPFHKAPKAVVFGSDIPVTSTGKYQRGKLRPLFARWAGEQFQGK